MKTLKIKPTGRGGLHIYTRNGYIVSCQMGAHSYSDNYNAVGELAPTEYMEVAIWSAEEGYETARNINGDETAPYVLCANMFEIVEAVEAHDWDRVDFLCEYF
jgi:hypothetical protein